MYTIMKKTIITIILILIALPLITATDIEYTFKQNTISNLRVGCTDATNLPCNSSVVCNISVFNPDGSPLINNQQMTRNDLEYNYSLSSTQTANIGVYSSVVQCQSVLLGTKTFNYEVTSTGNKGQYSSYILLFIIGLGIILLVLAVSTSQEVIGFISGIMFFVAGIYLFGYGLGILSNLYSRILATISLGFGIMLMIISTYEYFK